VELVEGVVDLGRDAPDDPPAAPRQEVLSLAVLEVRVRLAAQEQVALELERGNPRRSGVQPERQRTRGPPKPPVGKDSCWRDGSQPAHHRQLPGDLR